MKKIIFIIILLTFVFPIIPQMKEIRGRTAFNRGDIEFGFSANLGQSNTTTRESYSSYNYYDSTIRKSEYEHSDGSIYLQIGAILGYYIMDGLSIEPEMDLRLSSGEFSVSLLGNLCYSFHIPQKNIFPYLKIGYGYSNLNDFYFSNSSRGLFESLDFRTLNAGAGVKLIYSSSTALRMEINYRNLSGSADYSFPMHYYTNSRKSEITVSVISLSVGLSILI